MENLTTSGNGSFHFQKIQKCGRINFVCKNFSKNDPSAIKLVGNGTLGSGTNISDYVHVPRQVISLKIILKMVMLFGLVMKVNPR